MNNNNVKDVSNFIKVVIPVMRIIVYLVKQIIFWIKIITVNYVQIRYLIVRNVTKMNAKSVSQVSILIIIRNYVTIVKKKSKTVKLVVL